MNNNQLFPKQAIVLIEGQEFIGKKMIPALLENNKDTIFYLTDKDKKSEMSSVNYKEFIERVIFIESDFTKPLLGISLKEDAFLAAYIINEIWDFMDINKSPADEEDEVNCYSKLHDEVIKLAEKFNINKINYVKTQYDDKNLFDFEDFEAVKIRNSIKVLNKSEQMLIKSSIVGTFNLRIFRLPILIDHEIIFGSIFSKFLEYTKWFLDFVKERQDGFFKNQPLKVFRAKEIGLSIIKMDEALRTLLNIPKDSNKQVEVFNVPNTLWIPLEKLVCQFNYYMPELRIVSIEQIEELSVLEKLFLKKIKCLSTFLAVKSRKCSEIQYKDLEIYLKKWIDERCKWETERDIESTQCILRMEKCVIKCEDSTNFEYYTIGKGDPVIIANGLGPNNMIMKYLVSNLQHHYKVVIWETRGLKQEDYEKPSSSFGYKKWAQDIKTVMDYEGIKKCHIVAFCAGNKSALTFYRMHPDYVKSMILIAGEYTDTIERSSLHKDNIGTMAEIIRNQPHLAEMFVRALGASPKIKTDVEKLSEENLIQIISQIDPRYMNYIRAGILNKEGLVHYCRYCRICSVKSEDFECADYAKDINVPTLIISPEYDFVYNSKQSEWLHGQIADSKLVEFAAATHWLILEDWQKVCSVIDCFLNNQKGEFI